MIRQLFGVYHGMYPTAPARATVAGRAILEGRIVHVRDADAEPELAPAIRDHVKSVLAVPLLRDGAAVGVITLASKQPGGLSDGQVALLQTFAEQAVIAIASAETVPRVTGAYRGTCPAQQSRTGERIEQQSATIDVLKIMSSSPGDAQPVFELIARRALEFCGATGARLIEFDGELQQLRALVRADRMETEADATIRALYPAPPDARSIAGRVILDGSIVHAREPSEVPPTMRGRYQGSVVGVPLLREGRVAGAIMLSRAEPGGFSDTQVELLQTFAEQAVIAIRSAETFRALQERTDALARRNSEYGERIEHQAATIDVLKAMSASSGDTQPVFDLVVQHAAELCDAQMASLALFGGGMMELAAHSGLDAEGAISYAAQFPRPARDRHALGRAIVDRAAVQIEDLAADPLYVMPRRRNASRSTMAQPLLRDGKPVGAILIGRQQPGRFSDSQIALLQTFAEQAVIAIISAETFRALQHRHE